MKTIFDTGISPSALGIAFFLIQLPLVLAYLYRKSSQFAARSAGRTLPPGPPGIPILGNLFDLPKRSPWLGYRELSRRYGDLVFLQDATFFIFVAYVFHIFDITPPLDEDGCSIEIEPRGYGRDNITPRRLEVYDPTSVLRCRGARPPYNTRGSREAIIVMH